MCRVWVRIIRLTMAPTRHTSEFFGSGQNPRCLFTPDLRLFKPNTAQDEGISTNSQTQHRKTANI